MSTSLFSDGHIEVVRRFSIYQGIKRDKLSLFSPFLIRKLYAIVSFFDGMNCVFFSSFRERKNLLPIINTHDKKNKNLIRDKKNLIRDKKNLIRDKSYLIRDESYLIRDENHLIRKYPPKSYQIGIISYEMNLKSYQMKTISYEMKKISLEIKKISLEIEKISYALFPFPKKKFIFSNHLIF